MSKYPSPRSEPVRFRLPDERQSIVHKIEVAEFKGYIIVGLYEDGMPGELDIRASKEGTTLSGVLNAFSIAVSLGLQSGIPLKKFVDKYKYMRFEPMGYTHNPDVRNASSILDYVAKWLEYTFIQEDAVLVAPLKVPETPVAAVIEATEKRPVKKVVASSSAPAEAVQMMAKSG